MINLGTLGEIKDLRIVWSYEALDFAYHFINFEKQSFVITRFIDFDNHI